MIPCRQVKKLSIPREKFLAILRGESVVANLPGDCFVVSAESNGRNVDLLIHSSQFERQHYFLPPPSFSAEIRRPGVSHAG